MESTWKIEILPQKWSLCLRNMIFSWMNEWGAPGTLTWRVANMVVSCYFMLFPLKLGAPAERMGQIFQVKLLSKVDFNKSWVAIKDHQGLGHPGAKNPLKREDTVTPHDTTMVARGRPANSRDFSFFRILIICSFQGYHEPYVEVS